MSKFACKHCGSGRLRRLNRRGWAQLHFLPMLGFFPWECTICRTRTFWRDDGHRMRQEAIMHGPF